MTKYGDVPIKFKAKQLKLGKTKVEDTGLNSQHCITRGNEIVTFTLEKPAIFNLTTSQLKGTNTI